MEALIRLPVVTRVTPKLRLRLLPVTSIPTVRLVVSAMAMDREPAVSMQDLVIGLHAEEPVMLSILLVKPKGRSFIRSSKAVSSKLV